MAEYRTKVGGRLTAAMRRDLAAVEDGTATEAQFQRVVIAYAKDHGWLCHHEPSSPVRPGKHVTPTQGHVGFVDLVLVRVPRVLFMELKSSGGPTEMQTVWANRLLDCPGVEHYMLWPAGWRKVKDLLR